MSSALASLIGRGKRRLYILLTTLLVALTGITVASPTATAVPGQEYLVVSDAGSNSVYVYRGSDHRQTGSLNGIALSGHAGTLQLPDGHLIAVDDKAGRVVEIAITDRGRPKIVESVDIPGEWEGAAWAAADARLNYFALSGGSEEAPTISVVDLRTFDLHQIPVTPEVDSSGNTPETQVYLAGRPLQVVYTTGGKFHTVPLKAILTGQAPTVTSTAPVGAGTHGPVVSRRGDVVFSTTVDGVDGALISGAKLNSAFSVAYSTTRNIVHMYRPRLDADGRIWGAVAEDTGLAPQDWADTRNDVDIVNPATRTSKLVRLPDGVAGRLASSHRYAAVSTLHPDGDVLTLLDADRGSATYQRIVGTVALPALSKGPKPGSPTTGTQSHFTALNPSGSRAYVSQGGDGEVSVIDTATRRIVATIDAPSPLSGGGYLTVVKSGTPVVDLVAR